ncbi:transposase [bacterium]|nr:transposase [bacterium]
MPRNPKCFFNNTAIELCSSIQEGLPLSVAAYLNVIIEGILAAASNQFQVTICHYLFMGNHFHLIAIVHNPEDIPRFMRYLKCELAHAINRLLGRRQRSVWLSGYDSLVILESNKLLERIAYLYLNPVEASLVDKASEYPGVSSYQALLNGGMTKICKKISRDSIPALPPRALSLDEQKELAKVLLESDGREYPLIVTPWALLQCFNSNASSESYTEELLKIIKDKEHGYRMNRKRQVIGAHALKLQPPSKIYKSERKGLKVICLASDVPLRRSFISWFKDHAQLARSAFSAWKNGDFSVKPPPGFFAPGGLLLASALLPFRLV